MDLSTLHQIQSPRGIHRREEELWYAMRATYRRGQQARELLENAGAKCFIPMKWEEKSVRGRKVRRYTPVAGNLIFVYGRQSVIQNVKSRAEYLQYMTDSRSREKITVPEEQMQQFIFLKASDIDLTKGEKVRITGGEFEGRTGTFMRVKGAREKRVVVAIPGVMAVAYAAIHPSLVEKVG